MLPLWYLNCLLWYYMDYKNLNFRPLGIYFSKPAFSLKAHVYQNSKQEQVICDFLSYFVYLFKASSIPGICRHLPKIFCFPSEANIEQPRQEGTSKDYLVQPLNIISYLFYYHLLVSIYHFSSCQMIMQILTTPQTYSEAFVSF